MLRKLKYDEILSERKTIEDFKLIEKHPITVILHNIRSMYNVGSFFRTCDSALIEELILTGYTPYPPRSEIDKTALGATKTVSWKYSKNILTEIQEQKAQGKKIFAVELTNKKRDYDSLEKEDYPLCLIFGNELSGLDDDVIENCDDSIEIPMYGVKHSLNVSVSGGISIYEAVKAYRYFYNK